MVEVFKTNIEDKSAAMRIAAELNGYFPRGRINFDLDDCDKILRVESDNIIPELVANILTQKGFMCEVLE